jgi:hypothetical protein
MVLDGALGLLPGDIVISSFGGFEYRAVNGYQIATEEIS